MTFHVHLPSLRNTTPRPSSPCLESASLLTTTTHPAIGVTISVDRKAHGAELHLRWGHVQALRNELDRLLREAKQLDP